MAFGEIMATLKPFECRYGTLEEQIWIEKKNRYLDIIVLESASAKS